MIFFEPDRDRVRAGTLVEQAVQALQAAIHGRVLRPGMALPSIRQFARDHGLSTYTVQAAYNRLVAQRLIQSRAGADFRVARRRPPPARTPAPWVAPRIGPAWLLADVFADHSISIKAGCGWLPPDWHNEAGLQHALRQLARVPVGQMASYGHPLGYQPLRQHIADHLAEHGLQADADQVLLSHGATQALDILVRTLLRSGDHVIVESPCYANLLRLLAVHGIVVHGVRRTPDGLDESGFEAVARAHPVKAVFVTTVLQNPTGASFSMGGAFRLLQQAERHGLIIVEDDVSRELLSEPAPLLAALGGLERVAHVSGFAKSVMPSMRVGYLLCGDRLLRDCAHAKMSLGLTSAEMMERAVWHVLRDGRHERALRGVRERLRAAHQRVAQAMDGGGFELYGEPGAGLFLWARPWRWREAPDTIHMAAQAIDAGIWLAPGVYFDPAGRDEGWYRFNVAYSDEPRLWRFFRDSMRGGS